MEVQVNFYSGLKTSPLIQNQGSAADWKDVSSGKHKEAFSDQFHF